MVIRTFWLFLSKINKNMEISKYQDLLKSIEKYNATDVAINEMSLERFCELSLVKDYKVVLKPVNTLTRFDFYYTSYQRYDDDKKIYRRQYNELKSYNYPFSMPSYNNGERPLVPHLEFVRDGETIYKRLPNEVLITFKHYWNEK